MKITAKKIAEYLKGTVEGDENVQISNFGKIEDAEPGSITFLANAQYEHFIYNTKASAVLVSKTFEPTSDISATLIRVDDPYSALASLLEFAEQMKPKESGVAPTAFIHPSVKVPEDAYIGHGAFVGEGTTLGKGVAIYPGAYVGKHVKIGNNTILYPSVVVYDDCEIGNECILHAHAVIGADGFGFAPEENGYHKIPQTGNVVLQDKVEIGSSSCVDRAVMGSTVIEEGVKIDNLVQIAHNVVVGRHTVIAAQVGIAGSAKIGEWNMIGGQSGITGHIHTVPKVTIAARTGIISSLEEEGQTYFGSPAYPMNKAMRAAAIYGKLPDIDKKLYELEKRLAKFEADAKKE